MSYTCEPAARKVAEQLGFSCDGANPVITFRNPFDLAHWTMPLLELLIIGGAVFAFVHAWRRWRRDGDATNIALWFASLVYLAVVEPPLYFPSWFGLDHYVGFVFSHNVFTVQLMYDRLPLYIVAFYTVISQLTYEVVRVVGVFARRGAALGAVATAFACQVFYEIFDQIGPQLRWWAWNHDNAVNQPMLASVPMNSMWVFASVSFGVMTWLVVRLVGGVPRSGWQVAWRTVVAGVLTPVLMVVGAAPTRVGVGSGGGHGVQLGLIVGLLGLLWLAGLWLLGEATVRTWGGSSVGSPGFVRVYPAVYLAAHVFFWVTALPAYLQASGGITKDGTPIGSGWYALACFLASGWLVVAATRATRATSVALDPVTT
ncbi:MAG: hypothetical protein J2O46_02165 [Nocardioides sp.]|nr:hypothetical protein [Nocardioides sp.]